MIHRGNEEDCSVPEDSLSPDASLSPAETVPVLLSVGFESSAGSLTVSPALTVSVYVVLHTVQVKVFSPSESSVCSFVICPFVPLMSGCGNLVTQGKSISDYSADAAPLQIVSTDCRENFWDTVRLMSSLMSSSTASTQPDRRFAAGSLRFGFAFGSPFAPFSNGFCLDLLLF